MLAAMLAGILFTSFSVAGYCRLFGRYSQYDDEGYLMISLRQYIQGFTLYDDVYSQYGPFYYVSHRLVHGTLGVPITHDSVRWVFLCFWLSLTFACFRVICHLTRSRMAAVLGCIPFFWMLRGLASEPAHPQGIILVLIAVILVLPTFMNPSRLWFFAAVGASTASLILVKVNIGVYLLASLLCAMLAMTRNTRWTATARYTLAFACFWLPPLLMRVHLRETWAQKYALLTMITLAPILMLLIHPIRRIEVHAKQWIWLGVSMIATASVIVASVLLRGSTLLGLISALIWRPMLLPSIYFIPPVIDRASLYHGAFSLLLFAIYLLVHRFEIEFLVQRRSQIAPETVLLVPFDALLMGSFGLAALYYFYQGTSMGLSGYMEVWNQVSPFLWIALIPGKFLLSETPDRYFLRVLLVLTAAFQILHAYPVAGSQTAWSMIWIVPVAMVCLHDAWQALPSSSFVFHASLPRLRETAVVGVLLVATAVHLQGTWRAFDDYKSLDPLNLPGAVRLRTDWLAAETYRELTANLRDHADTFIGLPGLNSLYFWTAEAPPSTFNVGFWTGLLNDDQQAAIVAKLSRFPKACVIRNRPLAEQWSRGQLFDERPLVAYINQNFRTVGSLGNYEFMVRKERPDIDFHKDPRLAFAMMKTRPDFVRSQVRIATVDGIEVLLSPGDNEMRFPWREGVGTAVGEYGLTPDRCAKDNAERIRVIIEKQTPYGIVPLLDRTLNRHAPEDRGVQRFQVSRPSEPSGTLILRTELVDGSPMEDCFYWAKVAIPE
jgi:hypothetical protein